MSNLPGGKQPSSSLPQQVAEYWTRHNVTLHRTFQSREESIEYFWWRCHQYPGYLTLMPVQGFDGKDILDFGCGPGHDLIGFAEFSKPNRLVGADVSPSSLLQAKNRCELHGKQVELAPLDPQGGLLPFSSGSFDYIHASGVLHHVPDLTQTLSELRRVLRPGGRLRAMVYNRDSVWLHLYVAFVLRIQLQRFAAGTSLDDAFRASTDGPECPVARCFRPAEFIAEVESSGLQARLVGVAPSLWELQQLAEHRLLACMDERLEREHREFLLSLTWDRSGYPMFMGEIAGIDSVFELSHRD